jgi:hypothetical protein
VAKAVLQRQHKVSGPISSRAPRIAAVGMKGLDQHDDQIDGTHFGGPRRRLDIHATGAVRIVDLQTVAPHCIYVCRRAVQQPDLVAAFG